MFLLCRKLTSLSSMISFCAVSTLEDDESIVGIFVAS